MAIGLGQMLIGGLIGSQIGKNNGLMQMLGNKNNQEMPEEATHTMPDGTVMPGATHQQYAQAPQQGGGFTQNIRNMLGNPSDEKIAKMGLALNSMRMHPDANLATSFRSTIDKSLKSKQLEKQTNATITHLQGLTSTQYPNGRTDLVSMLEKGIITPTQAVTESMKVTKPSALAEKFDKYTDLAKHYGGADKIPENELQILGISSNDVTSIEEYEYYKINTTDPNPVGYLEFVNMQTPQTKIDLGDKQEITFWTEYNKKMIDDLIKWRNGGGADQISNLVKLKDALYELEKPNSMLTGPIVGMAPDLVNAFINPGATDVRESIESVVQRNLKAVLGAQFTEKEGERLISRAFNPKLSPERNARRLRLLIEAMEQAAMANNASLEWIMNPDNKSTFQGFTGAVPNMNDMWTAIAQYKIGDIIEGKNGKKYEYVGGDDKSPSSFKLIN